MSGVIILAAKIAPLIFIIHTGLATLFFFYLQSYNKIFFSDIYLKRTCTHSSGKPNSYYILLQRFFDM